MIDERVCMQAGRLMEFVTVAEKAAIASSRWNGKGDKVSADQAATTAMRDAFNDIDFSGRIVIGEGERDEAPMLYIGEELGRGGEGIDIAVDPLEGTNLCAYNRSNSWCTIAVAPRGALLYAPDTYMWKVAAGPACKGKVSVEMTPTENIQAVAKALGKPIDEVNVVVLDRERHEDLIAECRAAGARVSLIDDGDVFAALATTLPGTGIDLYMGSGGAPEGVLACTGLKAIGGEFSGKLAFELDPHGVEKRARAEKTAEVDLDAVLTMDTLVRSDDAAFIACGVTHGDLVKGVCAYPDGSVTTECVLMNALDHTARIVRTCHRSDNGRIYL
jgi:fructose-1,6-bisphosphatase class II